MSTKIYNGYKIPNMSFLDLKVFTDELRESVKVTVDEMFCERAARVAINMIDFSYIYKKEEYLKKFKIEESELNFSLFFKVWDTFNQKNKNIAKTELRDSYFDFSCELCLIPIEDKILCLYYGESEEFTKVFQSFENVESYYYYNNSDEPEDVSEEEWDQRRDDWNKALPGIGIPSENGFIVQLNKEIPLINSNMIERIIEKMPSIEKRLHKVATEMVVVENSKKDSYDSYIDTMLWLDSDEGKLQLNKKKEELSEILPKEITKEFLTKKMAEFII